MAQPINDSDFIGFTLSDGTAWYIRRSQIAYFYIKKNEHNTKDNFETVLVLNNEEEVGVLENCAAVQKKLGVS